jgi:lipopolysaccharide biosynthesis glycosyltransferase
MKKIPIVFCFDDNLEMPAGVCLTSLLLNAKEGTFYDIFILHSEKATFPTGRLNELPDKYKNCRITYRCVGDEFKNAFEIRGITIAAYYRLLIPDLIPEYDKIMYHDTDVIFRNDLSEIYENTDLTDYYVAGVSTPYSDIETYMKTVIKVDLSSQYIASGNIIINSKKMREDNIVSRFKVEAKKRWRYQDMDVLNIVCAGKIKILPPWFCIVGTTCEILSDIDQPYYSKQEAEYAIRYGTIHYNGPKPWKEWCLNFDVWWEYYRESLFFDSKFYYDFYFYRERVNEYDALPFWKRIKILLRYFKTKGVLKLK